MTDLLAGLPRYSMDPESKPTYATDEPQPDPDGEIVYLSDVRALLAGVHLGDERLRAALREWDALESSRRLMDYTDEDYDDVERLAGKAATRLMAEARRSGITEGLLGPVARAALATPAEPSDG